VQPEGLDELKNSPHWALNQRPSNLQLSALTTMLPCAPIYNTKQKLMALKELVTWIVSTNFKISTVMTIPE
jgi:hypothetical protein